VPERYDQHGGDYHISGLAWIGQRKHPGQERWYFILIAKNASDGDEIDWHALLPGDKLTGWLTPDPDSKTLNINPAADHDD
jgi:hypothetical protein